MSKRKKIKESNLEDVSDKHQEIVFENQEPEEYQDHFFQAIAHHIGIDKHPGNKPSATLSQKDV